MECRTILRIDIEVVVEETSREHPCPGLHVPLPTLQVSSTRLPQHATTHSHEWVVDREGCLERATVGSR